MEIEQFDVKTAFLLGDLKEKIYIEQHERFNVKTKEELMCKLKKNLYVLRQTPRQWYKKFDYFIENHGFNMTMCDHYFSVTKFGDNDFIILCTLCG